MLFLIVFFLVVISISLFIHFRIERYSPLIYPYLFWIIYELPKINFFNVDLDEINQFYYLTITIGGILYFVGILFDRILVRGSFFDNVAIFKDINLFQKISIYLFVASIIYFGYFFIFKANFNFFYFFSRRLGDDKIQELVASNYLFVLLINISILFQTISLTHQFEFNKLLRFVVLLIVIFLFTGSRGFILLPVAYLIIQYSIKKGILYIVPILVVAFFSFSILGSIRSFKDINTISIQEIIDNSKKFSINEYQLQDRDIASLRYYENRSLFYGSSYLAIFTSFIPRSILGDFKPEMLDGKIGREVFRIFNAGFPLHPVTESILNFGIFGLLVLFFLGVIFSNFLKSSTNQITYFICGYIIIFTQTGYSTYCLYAFQYLLCIYFISILTRIKFRTK